MSDLLREIDQELRQDRAREWMVRYGPKLLVAAVAIVALVAIGVFLNKQEMERRAVATAELISILGDEQRPIDLNIDALTGYVEEQHGAIGAIGEFHLAAELARQGDVEAARGHYQGLATNGDLAPELQDLALLFDILLRLDTDPAGELIRELQPLTMPDVTWRWSAQELTALLHVRQGDIDQARRIFAELAITDGLPVGLRARVFRWQEIFGTPDEDPSAS
ncbi:MAG: hypothetical protein KI792_04120 [Alphaproteobacteria bacterium]|nr:hypothetical protein [Alphaproteobacteria bacterium SS10]